MTNFLYNYSYFAIFILSFISSMGLPAGSELAILGGGALASGEVHKLLSDGSASPEAFHLSIVLVIALAAVGEILGSLAGYLIGYFGGRPLVDRFGKYVLLTHKDLDRAEVWFDRHGEPLVLFGRFIPLLRSFVSFAAGLAEMKIVKFVIFTVIGCTLWSTGLALLGYSLGSSYDHVQKSFSYAGYVVAILAVVTVVLLYVHRLRTMREERN
jgi:membrane protein DedA with SNARE-associated domain